MNINNTYEGTKQGTIYYAKFSDFFWRSKFPFKHDIFKVIIFVTESTYIMPFIYVHTNNICSKHVK